MIARLVLALALLAGAAAAEAPGGRLQRILERGRLIVGVKADYPPWGMVAPDGSIVGLEPDLARDAAERLGVELELVPVTAGNRLQRLEQGQVDLVIATLGDTAERRLAADLVLPHYYASGVNLLAPTGSPFRRLGPAARPAGVPDRRRLLQPGADRALPDRPGGLPRQPRRADGAARRPLRRLGLRRHGDRAAPRGPDWPGYRMAMPTILRGAVGDRGPQGRGRRRARPLRRGPGRRLAPQRPAESRCRRNGACRRATSSPPSASSGRGTRTARPSVAAAPTAAIRRPASAARWRRLDAKAVDGAGWTGRLRAATGIDLGPLVDPLNRARLLRGIGLTLALSLVAIAGSLGDRGADRAGRPQPREGPRGPARAAAAARRWWRRRG